MRTARHIGNPTGMANPMKLFRENPEDEENTKATKQSEREIFALKMQVKQDREYGPECGMLRSQCECWDAVNQP